MDESLFDYITNWKYINIIVQVFPILCKNLLNTAPNTSQTQYKKQFEIISLIKWLENNIWSS